MLVKSRGLMTTTGGCRGLYTLGAVGIGNSRECLTPRRAVSSNYATSPEESITKASSDNTTSTTGDIQWGKWNREIPTGGPCMYGFRASILLPHHSSSSPDTYLNHRGRTTDPKRKNIPYIK